MAEAELNCQHVVYLLNSLDTLACLDCAFQSKMDYNWTAHTLPFRAEMTQCLKQAWVWYPGVKCHTASQYLRVISASWFAWMPADRVCISAPNRSISIRSAYSLEKPQHPDAASNGLLSGNPLL